MIGNQVDRQISVPRFERVLDLTEVAQPLTLDDIINDIDEIALGGIPNAPVKIIVWEHQRDWLLKCWSRDRVGIGAYSWEPIEKYTKLRPASVDTIMGIPLEVRK